MVTSMFPKVSEASRQAGFTLLEVLVALVVAGLALSALASAFQVAWSGLRAPEEIVSAVAVAQAAAQDGSPDEGVMDRYAYARRLGAVRVVGRRIGIAPAPAEDRPGAAPETVKLDLRLQRISVVVITPSGRRITFDTVRLENDAR